MCLFLLLARMLLARQSWQKWVVWSRHINAHHCHVEVRRVTTSPPPQQARPTFWRKDKRSKNVAMIEQFWLRVTHLPPGETTRGRAFGVATSPIVRQRQPTLNSIGVPDARGVKKQRMILTNAKGGTSIRRDIGESHSRMFRGSFPGWWGQQYGSAHRLQTCTLHLNTGKVHGLNLRNCERTLSPASSSELNLALGSSE